MRPVTSSGEVAAIGLSALAAGAGAIAASRMKPSTRAYIRSVGWRRPDLWLHGMFYFSHTLQYIRMGRLATGFAHRIQAT